MPQFFHTSSEALTYFKKYISDRGMTIVEEKSIPTSAGRGRTVYQKQLWIATREIFHIKHWNNKWVPKDSSKVSEFAKPLDERLKYCIRYYGEGDLSASGINEGTLLDLLEIEDRGYDTYLVTTYKSGEVLWCKTSDLNKFAAMHGLIPQYSQTYGEPFCWIPTGWLKPINVLVAAFPEVIK
jgi:hypothetical protein